MFVNNCNECEYTHNCKSFYGWTGCRQQEDILKHYDEESKNKKIISLDTKCSK